MDSEWHASPVGVGISIMTSLTEPPAIFLPGLLACALPLLFGLLIGRGAARRQAITAIGGIALGLTLLGMWLYFSALAPLASDINLGELLFGIFLSILGFPCACFGCGVALATARRAGHHRWFALLLLAALLPPLAALATFEYQELVAARVFPEILTSLQAFGLALLLAPVGTVALVACRIYGQCALRRSPTSQ